MSGWGRSRVGVLPGPEPAPVPADGRPDSGAPSAQEVARLLDAPQSLRGVYQPIVDLRSGDCAGFRAFVRLADSPGRSPQSWFEAAAHAGLGGRLEAASLAAALSARARVDPGRLLMLGLATRSVDDPEVLDLLTGQPNPELLVVEFGPEVDPAGCDPLRAAGIGLACAVLDGGRSDLARLSRTRPDLVTLGADLVRGAAADPLAERLVRLVVRAAADLGAGVVATGLEDLDDARLVQRVGATMGQGWLFGRPRHAPAPAEESAVRWVPTAWQDLVTTSRVGRLAGPVPPGWGRRLDATGRLLALTTPDGRSLPAATLPRLRASQELVAAATRLAGLHRTPGSAGLVVIVDGHAGFLGVTDRERVLSEALLLESPGRTGASLG